MFRIKDTIYSVEGLRIGRVYVIIGDDGLTLIDTSIPNSLPQIQQELHKIKHDVSEIKRILITHAHYDHIGSLAALPIETLCLGHGIPYVKNAGPALQAFVKKLK